VAILVDDAVWPWRGRQWAHLVSDESYDELHAFAAGIGIPRRAFQGDHYDIPAELRVVAIEQGALPVDGRSLVRRLRAAGLRRPRPSGQERRQGLLRRTGDHGPGSVVDHRALHELGVLDQQLHDL
jgi:hypothetical protein